MPVTNPFAQQLQQLNAAIPNARQGLVDLYKLRSKGRQRAYGVLDKLYGGELSQLQAMIGSNPATFAAATRGGQQLVDANGYAIASQAGQAQALAGIVGKGAAPYQALDLANLRADRTREQSFRGAALQEQKSLKGALPRERSAALSELETGFVDTQTNLALNQQAFDQQQAYNQSLQRFYDASTANFAVASGQPVTGGLVESAARRYLGVPYKWGGESMSGFDCSGLTQQVFRDLGINLPRTAAQQQQATSYVGGLRNAQPGDLLFWGSPAHHVAIYIGNGLMIAAPHRGANVQVQQVYGSPEVHRAGGGVARLRNQ